MLGMAIELESVLTNHVQSGVLSVPHGSSSHRNLTTEFSRKFQIFEGAKDNIPDTDSLLATKEILRLIAGLSESSILLVLISGGGSSLLYAPIDGITSEEKQETVRLLAKSGASIVQLNTVRKRLSQVKGGKLAQLSHPTTTISLILSDVIGDPLDIIASGPTVENRDLDAAAWDVVKECQIENQLPESVLKILTTQSHRIDTKFDHVTNILLGNNLIALRAAESYAESKDFACVVLSSGIVGEAKILGHHFARLSSAVSQMMKGRENYIEQMSTAAGYLNVDPRSEIEKAVRNCFKSRKNLCLIGGGESTVKVKGSGTGGRNQEMVLAWAVEIAEIAEELPSDLQLLFLSAGTDGIDGPTDAAGAVACPGLVSTAKQQGLHSHTFLVNNDSYAFFRDVDRGAFHVVTGHTGTNVMDLHVICFIWKDNFI